MVLVSQHVATNALKLFSHALFVGVVETVPLVAEPVSDHHRQPQAVREVEQVAGFVSHAPGPERIAARGSQQVLRRVAPRTLDEVWLPTTKQLPAPISVLDNFNRNGLGPGALACNSKKGNDHQSTKSRIQTQGI